jgi:hypothetical protein
VTGTTGRRNKGWWGECNVAHPPVQHPGAARRNFMVKQAFFLS